MAFTTQIFIFAFLPILLISYFPLYFLQSKLSFLKKIRSTDILLILFSLLFYSWACFRDVLPFISYILLVYLLGVIIGYIRKRGYSIQIQDKQNHISSLSIALVFTLLGCAVVTGFLVHFKCMPLISQIFGFMFKKTINTSSIIAPLGISFISFSAISYLVDVYKGKAEVGNFMDFLLYMSLFTKVVSGPIVLWRDYKNQTPCINGNRFVDGIVRIMIGFAKKLILADTFGACIASMGNTAVDIPTAWGRALLYMLQIYYDFSGYSDIAIGLSAVFGFEFKENFNFPYVSTSITEFWRRWHISLGQWFREYIYFPLGGNRRGKAMTIFNISVVFLLTGIWHGAGWTYILWGLINGACNIIEKLIGDKKVYVKTPKFIKWFFTMFITLFCWELFRAPTISSAASSVATMFGANNSQVINYTYQYYFDSRLIILVIIGILGATLFGLKPIQGTYQKLQKTAVGYTVIHCLIIILFLISLLFMVNSTYSPFIYFQY